MSNFLKHFWFDLVFAAFAYAFVFYATGHSWVAVQTAIFLSILEISVSFDNAVVNAKKIEKMNAFWRMAFLTVGMFFAVGIVRFWLPLEIVSFIGNMSLSEALNVALHDHAKFKEIIAHSHHVIAGFGGAFLGMLAIEYFMNTEKETHWLPFLEQPLQKLKVNLEAVKLESFAAIVVLAASGAIAHALNDIGIFWASIAGVVSFIIVELVKNGLELLDESLQGSKWAVVTNGLGAFLFLEVLDMSMSADGVVAAIALSGDVLVVASGLAVGALAVRSLTIKLVSDGTLTQLKYLENGAFLSILVLAASMYVGLFVELPEWSVGLVSVCLLGGATYSSIRENKKLATEQKTV